MGAIQLLVQEEICRHREEIHFFSIHVPWPEELYVNIKFMVQTYLIYVNGIKQDTNTLEAADIVDIKFSIVVCIMFA